MGGGRVRERVTERERETERKNGCMERYDAEDRVYFIISIT